MPVDYLEFRRQIQDFAAEALLQRQGLEVRRLKMDKLLTVYADRQAELRQHVEAALKANPALRCAIPTQEPVRAVFHLPQGPDPDLLIAADGSQVLPSRHRRVEFAVINIGMITLRSGDPPVPVTQTRLLSMEELLPNDQLITESRLNLIRDLEERKTLSATAKELLGDQRQKVVTLTDGPLELFRDPQTTQPRPTENRESFFDQMVASYQEYLGELDDLHAAVAGYVDKPLSNLVIHLLELLPESEAASEEDTRLAGLNDASLFRDILTDPGDRSALFRIQSPSLAHYSLENTLYFYYLNIGLPQSPAIARVEIPAWTARDPDLLKLTQTVIFAQCRIVPGVPYPYVLHRAHEIAVINQKEADALEELIVAELVQRGALVGHPSYKQALKDERGRSWG